MLLHHVSNIMWHSQWGSEASENFKNYEYCATHTDTHTHIHKYRNVLYNFSTIVHHLQKIKQIVWKYIRLQTAPSLSSCGHCGCALLAFILCYLWRQKICLNLKCDFFHHMIQPGKWLFFDKWETKWGSSAPGWTVTVARQYCYMYVQHDEAFLLFMVSFGHISPGKYEVWFLFSVILWF